MKIKELEFIRNFNQINVKKICDEYGYNPKNVYSGKTKEQNMFVVYAELKYRIKKLLLDDDFFYMNEYSKDKKIEVLEDE